MRRRLIEVVLLLAVVALAAHWMVGESDTPAPVMSSTPSHSRSPGPVVTGTPGESPTRPELARPGAPTPSQSLSEKDLLTVDGVSLGMTRIDVYRKLGRPQPGCAVDGKSYDQVAYLDKRLFPFRIVTFAKSGRVEGMEGNSLYRNGSLLLRSGQPQQVVEKAIGVKPRFDPDEGRPPYVASVVIGATRLWVYTDGNEVRSFSLKRVFRSGTR